MGMSAIDEIV